MKRTHGMNGTPTWHAWSHMLQRCKNPKNNSYRYYGARGIRVCLRWRKFKNFLADMGIKPDGMTLDRKRNNGHYSPSNCRWATRLEQNNNKRSNVRVTHGGVTLNITQWGRRLEIPPQRIFNHIYKGKSPLSALLKYHPIIP